MLQQRRYRLLMFAPQTIVGLLTGRCTVELGDLPPDAQVLDVHFDHTCRAFQVCISSAEFDEVGLGESIPRMKPPVVTWKPLEMPHE